MKPGTNKIWKYMSSRVSSLLVYIVGCLWYYRDFHEGLSQTIARILYETNVTDLPSAPEVSNYMVSEVLTLDSLCHCVFHILLMDYILVCVPWLLQHQVSLTHVFVLCLLWGCGVHDEAVIANGNTDLPVLEGMIYVESEKGFKHVNCSPF